MLQGSILGPILILIYVSDTCSNLVSDAHQFADDTTLIYTFKDLIFAVQVVNHDLLILHRWAEQWRITFNPDKTFFLPWSFKTKNKTVIPNLIFCKRTISESQHLTTLGVTICNDINWDLHIIKQHHTQSL